MKYNGVILKKFTIMEDEISRLRALGDVSADRLDHDHFSLEAMGVLGSAERYRPMIQFRNFVVHRYERVDSAVLATVLSHHLDDLIAFRQEVTGVK